MREVLEVVAGGEAEAADEVPGGGLEVAVVVEAATAGGVRVVVGAAEVGIARDGAGAFEALQARAGLGLGLRVEAAAAEELVRRDGLLVGKLFERLALLVVCVGCPKVGLGQSNESGYRSIMGTRGIGILLIDDDADALIGPTEPNPPAFFCAAGLPTWPKPRRRMPMPRRSISAADFSRVCDEP